MSEENKDPFVTTDHKDFLQDEKRMVSGEVLHPLTLERMERHRDSCPICQNALKKQKKK